MPHFSRGTNVKERYTDINNVVEMSFASMALKGSKIQTSNRCYIVQITPCNVYAHLSAKRNLNRR